MDFCVIVKISRLKVSFWQQSGTSPFASLNIKDINEVPLFFYVNGSDFIFGENLAIDRFNSNDQNAFGNYFEIIKDPASHFVLAGDKKPVKQLLYHGIEKYLNFFITQVLYKNDSLESYRQCFPLRFWFDSDIEEKEKSLVESLFNEAGYDNAERVDFSSFLFKSLTNKNLINLNNSILLIKGIDDVLYFELFPEINNPVISSSKLIGQGADPSIKILAVMILEDILAQSSYLKVNNDQEIAFLLPYVSSIMSNESAILKGEAPLSDGNKYYFEVRKRVLEERLLISSNDNIVFSTINDILSTNSINVMNLMILMGSKEINTPYMINKLRSKFSNVIGVDDKFYSDALQLAFVSIAQNGYKAKNKVIQVQINPSNAKLNVVTNLASPIPITTPPPLPPKVSVAPKITTPPPLPPKVSVAPKITTPPPLPPKLSGPPKLTVPPAIPIKNYN